MKQPQTNKWVLLLAFLFMALLLLAILESWYYLITEKM
jgi:hypothetical protein